MEKVILVLDGYSAGKNIFLDTIKGEGYWTWNVNATNVLSMVSHKLGFEGERNREYYEFIGQLRDLANEYFDFERKYILSMIEKFNENEKAKVLIIHNCPQEIFIELQEFYANCFDLLISDKEEPDSSYCKTLNYKSETFVKDVTSTMEIFTKSFSKGE